MTLAFYIAAAVCDTLGFIFTVVEAKERLAARERYDEAVRETLPPMAWNAHEQVAALIRSAKGDARDADILSGLNELRETISTAETRLVDLSRPAGKKWRLWLGIALLGLGIVFGSVGNISGAATALAT